MIPRLAVDDIVTRLRTVIATPHGVDIWTTTALGAADEIEALRDLCARMATLLEDCRPADATLMWVMGRLDAIEEWQQRSSA